MRPFQEKLDFLGSLPIFADLTQPQLVAVAKLCAPYKFERGNLLAHKGDHVENLYIIESGRVEAFDVDDQNLSRFLCGYEAGDYFDDIWLFAPNTHQSTLRAATDGVLYTIHEDEFFFFLEDYPNAVLDLSEEAWDELDRSRATEGRGSSHHLALLPGELVEYETRRTQLLLLFEFLPPLFAAFVIPVIAVLFLQSGLGVQRVGPQVAVAVTFALPLLLFSAYRYLDWANDYLWITTKHLVHREFDLRTFSVQMEKIPIDSVQSIRSVKPTVLETFLGVGTVQVTTASQLKGLKFDKISNPAEVEQVYNKVRSRTRTLDEGRTRAAVRATLRQQFHVPDQMTEMDSEQRTEQRTATRKRRRMRRTGSRVDLGDSIVYGKHWFVLFASVWWVVLLIVATVAVVGWAYLTIPAMQIPFTLVAGGFVLFLEAAAYYYFYENWANDVFQLTNDSVIDIDRGPFGLTETRKVAQIANVQNVRAIRPNIVASLFNYGDVIIDTAGASAELIFEDVSNPTRVQTEIFERRELLMRNNRRSEADGRRKEIGLMLEEYRRLRDNDVIPNRPLPPLLEGDE